VILALAAPVLAFDQPVWWLKQSVGGGAFPTGVMSETVAQLRAPLYRSSSIVFRDTYAGAGARAIVTPVFADAGAIVSLAPIDVFDVDLAAGWVGYYGWGGNGLLPYEETAHKLDAERNARAGEDLSTGALYASAVPTLKAKVGPIVAFDSWNVSLLSLDRASDAPFVYEPCRDLVVAWRDVATEHQAGLLAEILPGKDRPLLMVGGTWRDRIVHVSGDRSAVVGGLLVVRPGTKPVVPQILVQGLAYVIDADRVGREPNVQAQLSWTLERPALPTPDGS
jgi:hypothetical protein